MLPPEPTAVNNGFAALIKNRGFMLLWIGQLISQLADKVFFALMIALLKLYLPSNEVLVVVEWHCELIAGYDVHVAEFFH